MFEFILAEQMGCAVRELRRRMTQAEFIEWQAFFELRRRLREADE